MSERPTLEAMRQLGSAEEFLDHFGITYSPDVVKVKRLHILQRFREHIEAIRGEVSGAGEDALRTLYRDSLQRAYDEFVGAGTRSEAVVSAFARSGRQWVFVPLSEIFK